jgi:hypothetical protein
MEKYQELLAKTLEVQSKTGHEKRMKKYVRAYLDKLKLKPFTDGIGNIYVHKGDKRKNRPFIVSHMDTVHQVNKHVKTFFNGTFYYAFDMNEMTQYGIGGDDKVGVWAALAALTEFDDISAVFMVQEEGGCVGSNAANIEFFKKANWLVQLDRRGFSDFITASMASDDFIKDMTPLAEAYGMGQTDQVTITDVSTLHRRLVGVSAVNIASGYFYPHSNREVVHLNDALNALELTFAMILQYGEKKYPHLPPKPKKHKPTTGYKQLGTGEKKDEKSHGNVWDEAKYVKGQIRIWNAFHGCFEWRDYSGNLMYYEGIGNQAQVYSENPKDVKTNRLDPPTHQEAIPRGYEAEDSRSAAQCEIDFLETEDVNDKYRDGYETCGPGEDITEAESDAYWDKMAERAARNDMDGRDREAVIEAFESTPEKPSKDSVKLYHDAELEYAEVSQARKQIDSTLYMYSHSFKEFTDGMITDEIIKNMSATLYLECGNTIAYYERIFGIEGTYGISADHHGSFTNFNKKEGDLPF